MHPDLSWFYDYDPCFSRACLQASGISIPSKPAGKELKNARCIYSLLTHPGKH
jgi:hypothetical protein